MSFLVYHKLGHMFSMEGVPFIHWNSWFASFYKVSIPTSSEICPFCFCFSWVLVGVGQRIEHSTSLDITNWQLDRLRCLCSCILFNAQAKQVTSDFDHIYISEICISISQLLFSKYRMAQQSQIMSSKQKCFCLSNFLDIF